MSSLIAAWLKSDAEAVMASKEQSRRGYLGRDT